MSRPSPEVSWTLDRLLGPVARGRKRQISAPPRVTTASAARARCRLAFAGRPATGGTSNALLGASVVTAPRNRYPTVGTVSMYRGSLGSSSRALRPWATARVRAGSVAVAPRPCEGVVGDRHIGPDGLENLAFGHHPVAVFDQEL